MCVLQICGMDRHRSRLAWVRYQNLALRRRRVQAGELAVPASIGTQGGEIGADARGIDAEIAAPQSCGRSQVDTAARARGSHANDDVVGEAKPPAPLACLN